MPIALLSPDDETLVKRVVDLHDSAKDHHESFRKKSERFYAKYRNYRDFKKTYSSATRPKDVDDLLKETAGPFGTNLFIPYCFSVIETTAPRLLSQNPKMLITPGHPEHEDNVESIELVVNRQQSKIGYPLISQDVAKDGLIYGLGWQKVFQHEAPGGYSKALQPSTLDPKKWVVGEKPRPGYTGPMAERIDPFDLFWDPIAHNVETARWIIHRQWRDNHYVKTMVESGKWMLPAGVDLDDVLGLGSDEARDDLYKERMAASGHTKPDRRGDHLHEVWEAWDCNEGEIITLLDRACPVQVGEHPYWHGELPFQCFRPTNVPGEMAGIGEIEPIEDLQEEMNVLRSQRRDNAAIVLQRPYFYFDGMLDPNDFVFGPGKAIPVDGDPRNIIFPAPLQDIPGSGYQEEAQLQRDIERTTGIDDTMSGAQTGAGAGATATGAQLVNAAANVRIQAKTRRFEQETVKRTCSQFVALNQQFIIEEQVVPGPPKPGEGHKAYSWYTISPNELAGEFEIEPEGGSMSPQSKIERQERAKTMHMMFAQHPLVDQRKLLSHTLEDGFEIDNPEGAGWLAPEEPSVPPEAMDLVRDMLAEHAGVPPQEFEALVLEAITQVDLLKNGGAEIPGEGVPQQGPPPQQEAQSAPPVQA